MTERLVRKFANAGKLPRLAEVALSEAAADQRVLEPDQLIVAERDFPDCVHVVLEGFACRYKILAASGRRPILDFLLPGDLCDAHPDVGAAMDHSIGTLTTCRVAFIPREALWDLARRFPAIARALSWSALVEESVAREWLVNIAARPADQRIAHLLCEICARLQAVGLSDRGRYPLPITQLDLADATGLSLVHANRMLQRLRAAKLVVWRSDELTLPQPAQLARYCGFESDYLHLNALT